MGSSSVWGSRDFLWRSFLNSELSPKSQRRLHFKSQNNFSTLRTFCCQCRFSLLTQGNKDWTCEKYFIVENKYKLVLSVICWLSNEKWWRWTGTEKGCVTKKKMWTLRRRIQKTRRAWRLKLPLREMATASTRQLWRRSEERGSPLNLSPAPSRRWPGWSVWGFTSPALSLQRPSRFCSSTNRCSRCFSDLFIFPDRVDVLTTSFCLINPGRAGGFQLHGGRDQRRRTEGTDRIVRSRGFVKLFWQLVRYRYILVGVNNCIWADHFAIGAVAK